jgi:hypothetical protein
MKTITGNEKFGFPETFAIILFLFLLIPAPVTIPLSSRQESRNQQDQKDKSHEESIEYTVRLRVGCRHVDGGAGAG